MDRKQKANLAVVARAVHGKYADEISWLTVAMVRAAILADHGMAERCATDGAACLLDSGVTKILEDIVRSITPSTARPSVRLKRDSILADLGNGCDLSEASKRVLVAAYCQGMRGDERKAAHAELSKVAGL